jgi:hypothetical protein
MGETFFKKILFKEEVQEKLVTKIFFAMVIWFKEKIFKTK